MKAEQCVEADGLCTPVVGPWGLEKYRLVSYYDRMFSSGMKDKWGGLVYIDLFAGAGYARIRGTQRIVRNSALLALHVPNPFTKYVFCEKIQKKMAALRERVTREHPSANVSFVLGDCNERIGEILREIPSSSLGRKYLTFCFVDPYAFSVCFSTITALSKACGRLDFIVLLPLGMDARRNKRRYVDGELLQIDDFLGDPCWRPKWMDACRQGQKFGAFIAESFIQKMTSLGYSPAPGSQMKEFRTDEKRLPLYHLAFFSKHPRGFDFWRKAQNYGSSQTEMNLG